MFIRLYVQFNVSNFKIFSITYVKNRPYNKLCLNCVCVTVAFHVLYHKKISYTFYCIADFYKHPVTILNHIAHIRKTARYSYFVCAPFWSMLNSSFCVLRIIIKYHNTNTKAHDRYHPCHYTAVNSPLQNAGLCPYNSKRICGNMTNHSRIHMP